MARSLRSIIKSFFETGDVPTQSQFSDSFDSQVFWEDDIEHTLTNDANKVPASDAVYAAIGAVPVPTLQDVTTAGNSTVAPITTGGIALQQGYEYVEILTTGQINVTPDTTFPTNKTSIQFEGATGYNNYTIPDKGGASDIFAMLSDITGGGVSSVTGNIVDNTDPSNPVASLTDSNVHTFVDSLTALTTLADADKLMAIDNSVSLAKKITWANFKATLKTYFDTIYQAALGFTPANISQSAYTMLANNTSGTANMAAVTFKSISKQTYTGSISWTGTTQPSGTPTQHSYSWIQIGNVVSFYICLVYPTAGATLSQVAFSLPSDMPTPLKPDGISAVSDIIVMCNGQLSASNGLSSNISRAALRIDSSSTSAFQFVVASASANYRQAWVSGVYFTS